MRSYIGHHTCSMGGGYKYVLENAPFLSKWPRDEDDPRKPYLGEGYYFWDDNKDQAKKWGEQWHSNWYYIIEGVINTDKRIFLDLVGDRQSIGHFALIRRKLISDGTLTENQPLGEVFEYLKKAERLRPGLFPYKVIRAVDLKMFYKSKRVFFKKLGGYTWLDPIYIFCLVEKNELILSKKRIIFQSRILQ